MSQLVGRKLLNGGLVENFVGLFRADLAEQRVLELNLFHEGTHGLLDLVLLLLKLFFFRL